MVGSRISAAISPPDSSHPVLKEFRYAPTCSRAVAVDSKTILSRAAADASLNLEGPLLSEPGLITTARRATWIG